jgi:plasmid maintenance system antidote protein VapI
MNAKPPTALKRYLLEHEVTLNALAGALGLDRGHLSHIVNGWATRSTTQRWAPLIADALGVPVHVIFPDLKKEVRQ